MKQGIDRSWIVSVLFFLSASMYAERELPIPPLLHGPEFTLIAQEGELTLPSGTTPALGFNGDYLGPTVMVENGSRVSIKVRNALSEATTVHWHGLHVPAEFDGGPRQPIAPGEVWNPQFTIDQRAATLWYHPHLMGKTAEHAYRGLAGLFIITDPGSDEYNIPRDYGENDIPVILQDRRIDRQGRMRYRPSMPDIMHGYLGNTLLTNSAVEPVLTRPPGTYRLRILNGSNSSIMRVRFESGSRFTVIASDGGFLPEAVETDELIISPGERYEILVDLNRELEMKADVWEGESYTALRMKPEGTEGRFYEHPSEFMYEPAVPGPSAKTRPFRLETGMMGRFSINGERMDLDTINFTADKDSTEIWTITNPPGMMMRIPHTFHVHDVQFSILSIDGKTPPPLLSGPKDTILVWPGEEYRIALRFEDYTGIYMYHCHLLEHEDSGMMGQFLIE